MRDGVASLNFEHFDFDFDVESDTQPAQVQLLRADEGLGADWRAAHEEEIAEEIGRNWHMSETGDEDSRPLFDKVYLATEFDRTLETPRPELDTNRSCVHGWDITNPSLLVRDDKVLALFRGTCIELQSRSKRRWYSKLLFGEASVDALRNPNTSWEWSRFHEAEDPRFQQQRPLVQECLLANKDFSAGPEDPKLLTLGSKTYVLITALDTMETASPPSCEDDRPLCLENGLHGFLLHLYELSSSDPITYGPGVKLVMDGMNVVEKNWNFFVHEQPGEDELMAVYTMHPYTIVKVDTKTGHVDKVHSVAHPLLVQLAKDTYMNPEDMHGGASVATINEDPLPGQIVLEAFPHHCVVALEHYPGSKVTNMPCSEDGKAKWRVKRRFVHGMIKLEANPHLCLDSINDSLWVSECDASRPEQRFQVTHGGGFGKVSLESGRCMLFNGNAVDPRSGNLTMGSCGEAADNETRKLRGFKFSGKEGRNYHLSVFHSPALGFGMPYRNWPYRFSTEPPFDIQEIGRELTPYLLTTQNPAYNVPVQFVTSIVYDKPSTSLGNIVFGYGSGDTSSRMFRMTVAEFESTFFGSNNASAAPDAFDGAAAIVQEKRAELFKDRKDARLEKKRQAAEERGEAVVVEKDDDADREFSRRAPATLEGEDEETTAWPSAPKSRRWRSRADDEPWPLAPVAQPQQLSGDALLGHDNDAGALPQPGDAGPPQHEGAFDRARAEELQGSARNLCVDGQLIPELVILGGQVNFSTQLVKDLRTSPEMKFDVPADEGGPLGVKKTKARMMRGSQQVEAKMAGMNTVEWAGGYPECPSSGRKVVAECSVGLLHRLDGARQVSNLVRGTPYQRRVQFLVLLRDPVRRMQADFRNYKMKGTCKDDLPKTFREAAKAVINTGAVCDCQCNQMVPKLADGRALYEYFALVDSSQFKAVPFKYAVDTAFPGYIWNLLGVQPGWTTTAGSTTQRFYHLNPLSEVLEESTAQGLQEYFEERVGNFKLHEVLANSNAELYLYRGLHGDSKAVATWLFEGLRE